MTGHSSGTPDIHNLNDSLWYATAIPEKKSSPLQGKRVADVAVIGGGFTGCSAALHLALQGAAVVLVESNEIGWGGSGRNAGLCNAGLWLDPDDVMDRVGHHHGTKLIAGLTETPKLVSNIIGRYNIDCDWDPRGVVKAAFKPSHVKGLDRHAEQWRKLGADIESFDREQTSNILGTTRYHGSIIDHRSGTLHPLSYARGLARAAQTEGASIHTHSPALTLERDGSKWNVSTPDGSICADSVVLATNAYSNSLVPGLKESVIPVGCFMCATEPLGQNIVRTILPAGGAMYDTQPSMYFARLDRERRLILGTLGYFRIKDLSDKRTWPNRIMRWLFPQLENVGWTHHWSGTIGFTPDHVPRLYSPEPGLYITLGYNGRGIGPGTFFGKMLAGWIGGTPESDLPLPIDPIKPITFRHTRQLFYQTAFRASLLRGFVS
tara:strand:- start:4379 stop:5683 length:1305 start_codon:yes stop_codon:yes gene_type:complete